MTRRTSPLPEQLRYLQPFRRKFMKQPEELDETTGMPLLLKLLRKRVGKLPEQGAKRLLEKDATALGAWLRLPGQVNDPLHFAGVLFEPSSVPDILRILKEEAAKSHEPIPRVQMEAPPGARVQRFEQAREGGMLIRWKGFMISVGHVPKERLRQERGQLTVCDPRDKPVLSDVRFGPITGTKSVLMTETWRGAEKGVKYVLKAPGGHVAVEIAAIGKRLDPAKWDEAVIESYFHSISITAKEPALNN
jgi:hypothetical protein